MSQAQLEKKVTDYLRNSQALEDYWKTASYCRAVAAEMERMGSTRNSQTCYAELFEALGNDPFVIAECLAGPALSERLLRNFYAHDQDFMAI